MNNHLGIYNPNIVPATTMPSTQTKNGKGKRKRTVIHITTQISDDDSEDDEEEDPFLCDDSSDEYEPPSEEDTEDF